MTCFNLYRPSSPALHFSRPAGCSSVLPPDGHGNYTTAMHRRRPCCFDWQRRSKPAPSKPRTTNTDEFAVHRLFGGYSVCQHEGFQGDDVPGLISGGDRRCEMDILWGIWGSTFRSGGHCWKHRLQIRHSHIQPQDRIGTLLRDETDGIFQPDDALPE
jgi:hypothetical protein